MQLSPGWERGKDPKAWHLSQRENEQLQVPGGNQSRIKADPTASSAGRVRHHLSNPRLPSETNKLYPPNALVEIFYLGHMSTRSRTTSGGTEEDRTHCYTLQKQSMAVDGPAHRFMSSFNTILLSSCYVLNRGKHNASSLCHLEPEV